MQVDLNSVDVYKQTERWLDHNIPIVSLWYLMVD